MELPCNDLLVHLGRCASQYSVSKEAGGEESFSNLDMESDSVVFFASASAVRMRIAPSRICVGMGDKAVLERSENSR